jgi:hypothetical protein
MLGAVARRDQRGRVARRRAGRRKRNALLAYDPVTWKEAFPESGLLLYGALFTVAFAAAYMPTLLTWRSRARQLVDAVYRTPPDGKPYEAWTKGRTALEQLLGINIGLMARLWGMLAIFGPLAASFLATSFPSSRMGSRPRRRRIVVHPSLRHVRTRMTWEKLYSTAHSHRSLIRPPWPGAATRDENRGMPGQARLSLVRQSPLIHGRFSFQDGVCLGQLHRE